MLIATPEHARNLLERLGNWDGPVAVDTESSGPALVGDKFVNMFKSTTVGISLCFNDYSFYIPVNHKVGQNLEMSWVHKICKALRLSKSLWAHNWKHDLKAFDMLGEDMRSAPLQDTQVMMWLLGREAPIGKHPYGLKNLALAYVGMTMRTFEETLGSQAQFYDLSPTEAAPYAEDDAIAVYRLQETFRSELLDLDLTWAFEREMRMVRVLRHMEDTGVALDVLRLEELHRQVSSHRAQLLGEWDWLVGCNPDSPKQLNEVMFDQGYWPKEASIISPKTGLYSTKAEYITNILEACPLGSVGYRAAQLKQELNVLHKIESTYTESLISIAAQYPDGRLHPSYHGTGTATGRLSSSYPNGQNIPIRTELGKAVQACFGAAPGNVVVSADYSQIELRCIAHLAGSGPLFDGYSGNADVHAAVAERYGISRSAGKTLNFAVLYGAGAKKLARTIGIDIAEAKQLLAKWDDDNASVVAALDRAKSFAYEHGYVRIETGRIRRFNMMPVRGKEEPKCKARFGSPESRDFYENVLKPRWSDERAAGNTVVQGFAADIVKEAMVSIYGKLLGSGVSIQAQIHDDIKLEVPAHMAAEVAKGMEELMNSAYPLKVPLVAEPAIGANWLEAK